MKTTDELIKVLENSDNLETYLENNKDNFSNISFTEYVNNKRLLLAYTLICNSNKTILEIMYATGYTSERTFYRCFKDYFNMTPMQLRNINKY